MTQHAISRFPAILLGGPPHAGKSVLANALRHQLRQEGVTFYHFSATPDGEGAWFQEATPEVGRALRHKGDFSEDFVRQVCRDLAHRPLPFLVDVGGRPQKEQEAIFDHCTHAILLVKDAESRHKWQRLMEQWNVLIIAIIDSQLEGESVLTANSPIIEGTLTRLQRNQPVTGVVFEALFKRVRALFQYDTAELAQRHRAAAPVKPVVDVRALYHQLYPQRPYRWQPQDIPALLRQLPSETPLALYNSSPVWIYTAIACHLAPQPCYLFDARLGWVTPVALHRPVTTIEPYLQVEYTVTKTHCFISLKRLVNYLPYQPYYLDLPDVSPQQGVIFSGSLPMWLQTSLAMFYDDVAWLAFHEPRAERAIVVWSTDEAVVAVGELVTF